jgi:hypothetical protein
MPPASMLACSSRTISPSCSGVASWPMASGPITYRRIAQCPTMNPAFTATRPSSAAR